MSQDLKKASSKSKEVLDLIAKQTLSDSERKQVIEESVQYWKDHVNEGFLQYRKSVSTDYTSVEWEDEGAVFR
ncbi:MAG: putrescine aminotransferase, partial [Cyanobacteria bacterium PR.3.49]|nr:putrescine aminotransferase [Cyanobacteria bacterium PR.3.49]